MKTRSLSRRLTSGMSLLEITLVLGLTLALITALLFGISAFQDGSDRARCIMNMANIQKAMRSFMNLYEYKPGIAFKAIPNAGMAQDLKGNVFGEGKFIASEPACPIGEADSPYAFTGDSFPKIGVMWVTCPNASTRGHVPKDVKNL